jgi:uncharacterized protein (TIGR02145 family)
MKACIIVFSTVLFITVISACTLQEVPDNNSLGEISITAETVREQFVTDAPGTKTTLSGSETHWVATTDKIGIFSPEAKATSDGTPEANPANNLAFEAQTSAKSSDFSGTMFWGSESDHHFYAYYPYNSAYEGNQTAVPISLPWAQTQSAAGNTDHIGALDYMVATPDTVASGGAVSLTFNHVFAMIEFQIVGSGTLTQVSLSGDDPLACEGTIDLSQTPSTNTYAITTSGTTKNVTVTLTTPVSLSDSPVSIYMMVLPGIQTGYIKIAITTDGIWKEVEKAALIVDVPFTRGLSDSGFVRGKKYVVTLDADDTGWTNEFTDSRDSNTYSYRLIGTQVWMTENLAYLPAVSTLATGSDTEPYNYVYGYDGTDVAAAKATANYSTYGVLYNWTAAMAGASSSTANPSDVQGLCPTGWHLPSDAEWTQLTDYLGGVSVAGGKMKETGTTLWNEPNYGATNESGFTGLPGGFRSHDGVVAEMRNYGYWWSSSEGSSSTNSYRLYICYYNNDVDRNFTVNRYGYSVRCVRN